MCREDRKLIDYYIEIFLKMQNFLNYISSIDVWNENQGEISCGKE